MRNIIWDVREPSLTYPLIQAIKTARFNWTAVCDAYNQRKAPGADPIAQLKRSEGGFYTAPAGTDDANGNIRQLRRLNGCFTPLTYHAFYPEEYTLLCTVLNEFCENSFKVVYQVCPQCERQEFPPYGKWCEDCQQDYQDREDTAERQAKEEQAVRDIKSDRRFPCDD